MAKIIITGRYTKTNDPWFEYANNKKEFNSVLDKIYSNIQVYGFVRKLIIKGNTPKYVIEQCAPSFIMEGIENI